MTWPTAPTCHSVDPVFRVADVMVWQPPRVDERYGQVATFRTCGYCGSIHPEDLTLALEAGVASLHGADWKYGWPHKFYVEGMPNQFTGEQCVTGTITRDGKTEDILGKPSRHIFTKWYNEHLLDAGYGVEEHKRLLDLIADKARIRFEVVADVVEGRRLRYDAPHFNFQQM